MDERAVQLAVVWTPQAVDKLTRMLEDARHAQGNPEWVPLKLEECLAEGVNRLVTFPDLRNRYRINGLWCNGMTLRAFPAQVFFRLTRTGSIAIFSCRWARQDAKGPHNP